MKKTISNKPGHSEEAENSQIAAQLSMYDPLAFVDIPSKSNDPNAPTETTRLHYQDPGLILMQIPLINRLEYEAKKHGHFFVIPSSKESNNK